MAAEAQAAGEGEVFSEYVGSVLNSLIYLLQDSLERLQAIHDLEQSKKNQAAWDGLPASCAPSHTLCAQFHLPLGCGRGEEGLQEGVAGPGRERAQGAGALWGNVALPVTAILLEPTCVNNSETPESLRCYRSQFEVWALHGALDVKLN